MEGIMGYCAKEHRTIIIPDNKMSIYYDEKIDLNTLLSVICLPILKIDKENEKTNIIDR